MPESVPRIRRLAIPDNVELVVRGDALDEMALRTDATRFHRRFGAWGRYGVSALLAADESEVEALCETRLERFATVVVFSRRELERLGIEVVPTFRTPHVTLAHPNLSGLVIGLLACEHRTLDNPYLSNEEQPMTISPNDIPDLDLVVDLNSEDESGLPWAFIDEAPRPELVREGAWLVVGQGRARAVAQVVEIDGNVVRVRPLPGPVSKHRQLLGGRVA